VRELEKANPEKSKRGLYKELMQVDGLAKTVVGRVMVTKNPCSHPGDIRILNAIDCENDPRFDDKQDWLD